MNGQDVTISWTCANIDYVRIYRYQNGVADWQSGYHLASEGTFTNSVPSTGTYEYKLCGYDSSYNLLCESNVQSALVGGALIGADTSVDGLDVTITWISTYPNLAYIRIYRYDSGDLSTWSWRSGFHLVSEGSFTNGVPAVGTYVYKLKGYDSAYNLCCESNLLSVVVGSALSITGATVNGLDVTLTWLYSDVTYVRIYRYDNGNLDSYAWRSGFHAASEGSYTNGVPAAGLYVYKLKGYDSAYNQVGESEFFTVDIE